MRLFDDWKDELEADRLLVICIPIVKMITRFFNVLGDIDDMCSERFLHKHLGDSPNVEYI